MNGVFFFARGAPELDRDRGRACRCRLGHAHHPIGDRVGLAFERIAGLADRQLGLNAESQARPSRIAAGFDPRLDRAPGRRQSGVALCASIGWRLSAIRLIPAIDLTLRRLQIIGIVWVVQP